MAAASPQARRSGGAKRRKSKGADVDEEADLEARLFGKKRSRSSKKAAAGSDHEDTGMGWMQDDEVG